MYEPDISIYKDIEKDDLKVDFESPELAINTKLNKND